MGEATPGPRAETNWASKKNPDRSSQKPVARTAALEVRGAS